MKKLMKYIGITTIALTAIGVAVRAMCKNYLTKENSFKPINLDANQIGSAFH